MSTYVDAFKGYIADVPKMWFRRCDGEVYYFGELTQCQVTPNTSQIEINAGHSLYPVAYLPGQSTMTASITSGQFDADLFAMANNVKFEDGVIVIPEQQEYEKTIQATKSGMTYDLDISLPYFDYADSATVQFYQSNGTAFGSPLTCDDCKDTQSGGAVDTFKDDVDTLFQAISVSAYGSGSTYHLVTNVNQSSGQNPYKNYYFTVTLEGNGFEGRIAKIDNKSVAAGEAVLKWPVYASGDDCTDSAIKGYVIMRLYRARITQLPGFDSSYKSAETFSFELSAMDAKRDDGMIYDIAYVQNDEEEEEVLQPEVPVDDPDLLDPEIAI